MIGDVEASDCLVVGPSLDESQDYVPSESGEVVAVVVVIGSVVAVDADARKPS